MVATQAFAGDASPQPLTRVDCDKAAIGWSWNENANICESSSQDAEAKPESRSELDRSLTLSGSLSRQKDGKARLIFCQHRTSPKSPVRLRTGGSI